MTSPVRLPSLAIQTDPQVYPQKWDALAGHVALFKFIKPIELASLNWSVAFYHILSKGTPGYLLAFLQLNLIGVNHTFDNGECAISILLHGSYLYRLETQRVSRLQANLNVILDQPNLILNRHAGATSSPRHLIFHSIDANLFPVFLQILDASPKINYPAIFRYVCEISHREIFFNYLLTCKLFNLFEPDHFNCSALHIAIRNGHTDYALALLNSPDFTPEYLLKRDTRTGRTVLHTAMVSSLDELVNKLFANFSDFDWDVVDYSGTSASKLYENRIS